MDDLISRQAAIDVIDAILPVEPMKNEYTQGITCGAALAIEYVKQLPSAQPELGKNTMPEQPKMDRLWVKTGETCTDVISRQAAIEKFEPWLKVDGYSEGELNMLKAVLYELRFLPSAQPEQDILSWLLAYHTKSFDLHGRYMPHEVIGWLVHDFANAYMAERREE